MEEKVVNFYVVVERWLLKIAEAEYAMLRSDIPAQRYWISRNVENLTEVEETEKSRDRKVRL